MNTARAAFRHPNFRYFAIVRFLATGSSEMQAVAVGWQIYALTHRALDLGLVGLAQFSPGILLFLLAGHAADRFPRKRILQCCYGAFALCSLLLLTLTLRGLNAVWPIYAVLLLNGTVRAFNGPASQSFLPLLVPEQDFPNAVTWNSSIFQSATILGPMAGGLVYGITGSPVVVYCITATLYLTALLVLSGIRLQIPARPRTVADPKMILEGLHYIWRTKLILGIISLDMFAVLLGGAVALLPVYAREILRTGPYGLGFLRSAPGLGAVIMAMLLVYRPLRRKAGLVMLWCVAAFGVFTIAFGLSSNLALSLAALVLVGASDMVSVVIRSTLMQTTTPDGMRGRVSAVNMVFVGASNEIGQFESGLTAHWFGTVPAVVVGGLGTIAVVGLWAWLFPTLRRVDELIPNRVSDPSPEAAISSTIGDLK